MNELTNTIESFPVDVVMLNLMFVPFIALLFLVLIWIIRHD